MLPIARSRVRRCCLPTRCKTNSNRQQQCPPVTDTHEPVKNKHVSAPFAVNVRALPATRHQRKKVAALSTRKRILCRWRAVERWKYRLKHRRAAVNSHEEPNVTSRRPLEGSVLLPPGYPPQLLPGAGLISAGARIHPKQGSE